MLSLAQVNDDSARFREKLESSAILGATAGAAGRILIALGGPGKLFPHFFTATLIGACAGATYIVTVRTAAFLTEKDWAWNHLAGGIATGTFIGFAAKSPALGRGIGIPLSLACFVYKTRTFDGLLKGPPMLKTRPRTYSPWGYRGFETYEKQPEVDEVVDILRNEDDYGKN